MIIVIPHSAVLAEGCLTVDSTTKRYTLRHFLAALAYRGTNILKDMPSHVPDFRPS